MTASAARDAIDLYDRFAADYDRSFVEGPMRRLYDDLAWARIVELVPAAPSVILDAGCGTGRGAERLLALGHRVIGMEPSAGMQAVLRERFAGRERFELLAASMEEARLAPDSVDAVVATGSLQYASDPSKVLASFARWVRPGGVVCVQVDSEIALALELLRLGRSEEAQVRLSSHRGVFSWGGEAAVLHLFDADRLRAALAAAGLVDIAVAGLLINASALGREACQTAIEADYAGMFALERQLQAQPALADCGKHLLGWGWRPPG